MIDAAREKQLLTTASINSGTQFPMFWKWMKWDLGKGEGRVFQNQKKMLASIHEDNKAHCVFTTSWVVKEKVAHSDNEMGIEALTETQPHTGIEEQREGENALEQEWIVTSVTKRKSQDKLLKYKTKWNTGEVTWEFFNCFVDVGRVCLPFISFAKKKDWVSGFSQWTVAKMKDLCKELGISRCMLLCGRISASYKNSWFKGKACTTVSKALCK